MELRQLKYFAVLAEELHFGRAAKKICIAQPALSQQIKALEEELGGVLFSRTTHNVTLTQTGQLFLTEARKILAQAHHARTVATQAESGYNGELVLGFVESAIWDILPCLISAYRGKYPQVEIIPHHMKSLKQIQALENKEIQLGIVGIQFPAPGVVYHTIRAESFCLALPNCHRLARQKQVHMHELQNEQFVAIRREADKFYFDHFIQTCMDNGFSPEIVLTADEMQPLLSFVACGMGIALVQESARHIRSDLCYRPVRGKLGPFYKLSLAWQKHDQTKTLLNFVEQAKLIYPAR